VTDRLRDADRFVDEGTTCCSWRLFDADRSGAGTDTAELIDRVGAGVQLGSSRRACDITLCSAALSPSACRTSGSIATHSG